MKKMILLALALVTAAVSQAVTVAWYVPNSDLGNWANEIDKIYIVHSTTAISADNNYKAAYTTATGYTYTGDEDEVVSSSIAQIGTLDTSNDKYGVYAPGLEAYGTAGAYYYMVAVSENSTEDAPIYAVAGGTTLITSENAKANGIIAENIYGEAPGVGDYVDLGWLGGTWTDAIVPEPTVMALLALGVAGMALRRKEKVL